MLDLGWSELLVIAAVALIVVGPKELPGLLRIIGQFIRAIRKQANEFRSQFDEAIKETEFEEVRKEFNELKSDVKSTLGGVTSNIEDEFRDLDESGRDRERELKNAGANGIAAGTPAGGLAQRKAGTEAEWMDRHNHAILASEKNSAAEHAFGSGIEDADAHTKQANKDKLEAARPTGEVAGKAGVAT